MNELREMLRELKNPYLTLAVVCVLGLIIFLYNVNFSLAQEHHHRPEEAANHTKFYRTWMMPDNRSVSCCHDEDCRAAEAYMKDGKWYARQDGDDGNFTSIPTNKIEQDRDSPDGRSHLCGKRYAFAGNDFTVFCFLPASGS